MLEAFEGNSYVYTKLSPEDIKSRGILGRLTGPIADTKKPTRNNRMYEATLWEQAFENPIWKEKIDNRCCFLELGHPADGRTETDMTKVCACLAETPKVGEDGLLYGIIDILPTDNGKLLKVLCDYGTNIGISSRGTGDIIQDYDGVSKVDPSTFQLETWDCVQIPACESARLHLVNESLDTNKLALTESLNKIIDEAETEKSKKIMKESLNGLGINLTEEDTTKSDDTTKECDNQEGCADTSKNDDGQTNQPTNVGEELITEFQEALQKIKELEKQVIDLQEQLSVSNAKEITSKETIDKLRESIKTLSAGTNKAKVLEMRVSKLNDLNKELNEKLRTSDSNVKKLDENLKNSNTVSTNKDKEIATLKESFSELEKKSISEKKALEESISELNQEIKMREKENTNKLKEANHMVEQYKSIATNAVDKYIDTQALRLGVSFDEIKNRLPQKYNFTHIDKVCEDLQEYRIVMNTLPVDSIKSNLKVKNNPSAERILGEEYVSQASDEDISDLVKMADDYLNSKR